MWKKKHQNVSGVVVNGNQQPGPVPKQQTGVGTTNPFTPVGTIKPKSDAKKPLKLAGVIAGVAILLGVGGYLIFSPKDNNDAAHTIDNVSTDADKIANEAVDSYNPETGKGYQDAIKELEKGIKTTDGDDVQTAQLYIQKASVYYKAKKYTQALQAAKKAEVLHPDNVSSAYIAKAYQGLGNNSLAAKYFRITISRIKAADGHLQSDVEYYEGLLREVL